MRQGRDQRNERPGKDPTTAAGFGDREKGMSQGRTLEAASPVNLQQENRDLRTTLMKPTFVRLPHQPGLSRPTPRFQPRKTWSRETSQSKPGFERQSCEVTHGGGHGEPLCGHVLQQQ